MARSDQTPTGSPFHAKSTGAEVMAGIDLTGQVAVVTGGYSGIGLETTRCLVDAGAQVIVPVRSPEKAAETLGDLSAKVTTAPLDLGDLTTVTAFADGFRDAHSRLDLLINNAGIMACPEARVGPGWESQFGTNHMGHFALTKALLPVLQATEGARVISLSSAGHKISDINWDDLHYRQNAYDKWNAYGQAKTANALFANGLARRLQSSGGQAFSLHPGAIFTPLQRHLPTEEMVNLGWVAEDGSPSEMAARVFKTPEQGCSTTVWAATSPALKGRAGVYCEDCEVAAPTDPNAKGFGGINDYASSDEAAERLWEVSEALLDDA